MNLFRKRPGKAAIVLLSLIAGCTYGQRGCTCGQSQTVQTQNPQWATLPAPDDPEWKARGIVPPQPPSHLREMLAPMNPLEEHKWVKTMTVDECADFIKSNKEAIHRVDDNGRTALHWAVRLGRPEVAKLLIDAGADLNAKDKAQRTPLDFVMDDLERPKDSSPADLAMMRQEYAQGAPIAFSPLSNSYEECVHLLIDAGANINCTDSMQRTPIYTAVRGSHANILKILLHAGADLKHEDRVGWTVFEYAEKSGGDPSQEILRILNKARKSQQKSATSKP